MRIAGLEITRQRSGNSTTERRSNGYADQLIRAAYDAVRGIFGGTSIAVNPDTALRLAAVHSCIRVKADSLATMPLKLYVVDAQGRRVAYENPLYQLIQEPNEMQTRFQFIKWVSAQLDISGNAFVKIYRDPATQRPIELEPIHHSRVTVKVADEVVFYHVQGEDEAEPIPATEMLHFKGLCYDSAVVGMSPIAMHATSLGINLSAEKASAQFYGKNASLKWVITYGSKQLDQEASNKLKESFNKVLDGSDPATVLPHGSELKQLNLSPQEAEYLQTRSYGAKDIARMFGVPAYMIGADDGGIKSSVEQQSQDFYVQTMLPLVVMIEEELKRKLLREDEKGSYYFKFQFNSLLRADSKSRAEFYNIGIRGGWLSPNDARKFEDMDLLTDGNTTYTESNLVPSDMMRPWIQSKINAAPQAVTQNNNPDGNN